MVIPVESCSGSVKEASENDGDAAESASYSPDDSYVTGVFTSEGLNSVTDDASADIQSISSQAQYYELRLKNVLETSYGEGSVQVMVHMTETSEKGLYGGTNAQSTIDGVLVVADVETANEVLTISEAVCALFNLPACKVYVIKKS